MNTLGDRLKVLRKGLSQHVIATKLGIPQTTWSNYENNKNKPDFAFLDKICLEFHTNADWLLFGRGSIHLHDIDNSEEQGIIKRNTHISTNITCKKCLELFERLYQSGENEKSLLKENANLRVNEERLEQKLGEIMLKYHDSEKLKAKESK